jgi:hypothetical protein
VRLTVTTAYGPALLTLVIVLTLIADPDLELPVSVWVVQVAAPIPGFTTVPDVFEAVGPPFVVDVEVTVPVSAAPVFDTRPVVMTTGMYRTSLGASVSVLIPGNFALSPPKDSVQTAVVVSPREQSK